MQQSYGQPEINWFGVLGCLVPGPSVGRGSRRSVADQHDQTRRFIPNWSPVMNRICCFIKFLELILYLPFWFFNWVHFDINYKLPWSITDEHVRTTGSGMIGCLILTSPSLWKGALPGQISVGGDVHQPVKGFKRKSLLLCLIGQIWPCGVPARDVGGGGMCLFCHCFKELSLHFEEAVF